MAEERGDLHNLTANEAVGLWINERRTLCPKSFGVVAGGGAAVAKSSAAEAEANRCHQSLSGPFSGRRASHVAIEQSAVAARCDQRSSKRDPRRVEREPNERSLILFLCDRN